MKNTTIDNMRFIMIDSVDIQGNLTVCRAKGLIYGMNGDIYQIYDVLHNQNHVWRRSFGGEASRVTLFLRSVFRIAVVQRAERQGSEHEFESPMAERRSTIFLLGPPG